MNNKEFKRKVIDIVKFALLEQGERSSDEYGNCVYRNPEGLKCGIGHLIKDELYDSKIETFSVRDLTKECDEVRKMVADSLECPIELVLDNRFFLSDIQTIHDEELVEDWESCFDTLERDNDLV